jgi:hypothetical protein
LDANPAAVIRCEKDKSAISESLLV